MKKTKKALATLAIAGMTLSMIPFNAFAATTTTRIAGMTAEQTAVKIADQTGYTGTAILASSTSYGMVDALTAGPLAASLKAPILLTGAGNTLNADTKAELTKLAVKKVYVTSGTAVIKAGVIDELKAMGIEVVALGGFDRAETSVNIAKQMTGVTKVAVANGVPDALSIASVASAANQPILLTNKDMLPTSVADYLATAGVTSTDVIGGTGVISDAVVAGLPGANRIFGMTAYDTNNQVIQDFAAGLEFDNVFVANGQTGIDALAGAPLAAQTKSAIVLTDGKSVPAAAAFTYGKNASAVVTALGGEAVVPESVRMGVAAGNVSTPVGDLSIVSVSALTDDGHVLSVAFNKAFTGAVDKSMVSIFNTANLSRVGVERVELSTDGKSLEVSVYDSDSDVPEIARLTEYTITVGSLKANFTRPGYVDKDTNNAYVSAVDSGERELKVSYTGGSKTLDVPDSIKIDFQEALGQDVKVWFDGKDNLLNFAYESNSVLYDAIEVIEDVDTSEEEGELNLVGVDKDYDISPDVILYVDGEEAADLEDALEDGDTFDYAKVVLNDDGDVERIYAFTFTEDPLVVKSVDDTYIESYDGEELDLEDYIIVKDGKEISVSDIKDGDLVFYNEDAYDEDGFALVYNDTASGEIDGVFQDSFDLDGENYSYGDAYYLDGDDDKDDLDIDAAEELQAGGDVVVYFNIKGDVVVVKGETGAVSSNYSDAILTEAILPYTSTKSDTANMLEITSVDAEGDESVDEFEVNDLDEIILQGENDEFVFEVGEDLPDDADESSATAVDAGNPDIEIDEFRLVEVDATHFNITANNEDGDVLAVVKQIVKNGDSTDNLLQISKDDNGDVVGLKFFDDEFTHASEIEYDDNYVDGYRLQDSTVVVNIDEFDSALYADDDSDVTFQTWADVEESKTDISAGSLVYVDEAGYVTHILTTDFEAGETSTVSALITRLDINNDDEIVRIHALVDGKEVVYTVDELDNDGFFEGTVAVLEVNDNSGVVTEITVAAERVSAGTVTDVDVSDDEITVDLNGGGTVTFTLSSTAKVYDATDSDGDDFTTEALRDVEVGDSVVVLRAADNSRFVNVVAMIDDAADYVTETDLGDLEDVIAVAEALAEADYTVDSWSDLVTALAAANDITIDDAQADVNDAEEALQDAIDALVDISALTDLIADAQTLSEEADVNEDELVIGTVTSAEKSDLDDAITAAEAVQGTADATQTAVNDEVIALQDAIDAFNAAVTAE